MTRRWLTAILCVSFALKASDAAACIKEWPPHSAPKGIAYFIASVTTVLDRGAVGVTISRAKGSAAGFANEAAVLVPWAYLSDCSATPWPEASWLEPGTRGVFTGWPRPPSKWLRGKPTFDVYWAGREPIWQDADSRWRHAGEKDELLTPEEFMLFYSILPAGDASELSSDDRRRVEAWAEQHPQVASKEPAQTILRWLLEKR